jgi:hypothetical protein
MSSAMHPGLAKLSAFRDSCVELYMTAQTVRISEGSKNVASHDGPLATTGAQRQAVFDNLTWRTRRGAGPFI